MLERMVWLLVARERGKVTGCWREWYGYWLLERLVRLPVARETGKVTRETGTVTSY